MRPTRKVRRWLMWSVATLACTAAALQSPAPYLYQTGHIRDVAYVGWSDDSATLFSFSAADDDFTIRAWDVESGRLLAYLLVGPRGGELAVPGKPAFRVTRGPENIEVRDDAGRVVWETRGARSQAVSPSGALVAEAGRYGNPGTVLRDSRTNAVLRRLEGHPGIVYGLAFSPDGRRVASANGDYTVTIRNALSGVVEAVVGGHKGPVHAVAFSPDGSMVASGDAEGAVQIADANSQSPPRRLAGHDLRVHAIAFSSDAKLVASGGLRRDIKVWEVASGKLLRTIEIPGWQVSTSMKTCCGSPVQALSFSPSGRVIASGCQDGSLFLWDVGTGKLLRKIDKSIASARAQTIRFESEAEWEWAAADPFYGTVVRRPSRTVADLTAKEAQAFDAVALARDGRLLATGTLSGTVSVWETRTGRLVRRMELAQDVIAVAFSPDSRVLATGGDDQTIRLWDIASGKLLWDAAALAAR